MATVNAKSNINVRIDSKVKENANKILSRMGIDQTTAIDMYYRQIIVERQLPFKPTLRQSLDEQTYTVLSESDHKVVELEMDENGNVIIDKKRHPDIYDWAKNG